MKTTLKIALIAFLATGVLQAQSQGSGACPSGQSSGTCPSSSGSVFSNYYYDSGGAWFDSDGTPSPTYANESSPPLKRNLPGYDTRPKSQQKRQSDSFNTRDKSGHRSITSRTQR